MKKLNQVTKDDLKEIMNIYDSANELFPEQMRALADVETFTELINEMKFSYYL